MVRRDVSSYRQPPILLYQFGEKFRDDIRPRFGVMRARNFTKDVFLSRHGANSDVCETIRRL